MVGDFQMAELDEIDLHIISKLLKDAQTPYKDIAKELNITRQTVAKRVKKLIKNGIITGMHCSVDYQKIGYPIMALILANMKAFTEDNIQSALKWAKDNNISILYWGTMTGRWDVFLIAIFRNVREMELFLMRSRENEIFETTETSIIMNLYRRPEEWQPSVSTLLESVNNNKKEDK